MGYLFASGAGEKSKTVNKSDPELWVRLGCSACSLDKEPLRHPKMDATGSDNPLVYILGEAPGEEEDVKGEQFVGKAGRLLRPLIPREFRDRVRFNNAANCRPPKNRDPTDRELACCRNRIIEDIRRTRPKAVFGLGGIALQWALGTYGISMWRGRRIPIDVGGYQVWYYPMFHPSFIARGRSNTHKSPHELVFELDLKRAFYEVENLPEPKVHTAEYARSNVELVTGRRAGDLEYIFDYLEWASCLDHVGLDFETNCLRPFSNGAKILTIALGTEKSALAFGLNHKQVGWSDDQKKRLWQVFLNFILTKVRKVVHNLAFEMEWVAVCGDKKYLRRTRWEDPMCQAYVLDERMGDKARKPGCFALDFLVWQNFGFRLKSLSRLNVLKLDDEPLEDVLLYNGMDAKYHDCLFLVQDKRIEAEGLSSVYEMQLRRVPTVVLTQIKGVPINLKVNKQLSEKYSIRISELEKEMRGTDEYQSFHRLTGHSLNPRSDEDVITFLRDVLRTTEGQEKDNGKVVKWSSDKKVLSAVGTELCVLMLEYRGVTKAKSTYVDSMPDHLYQDGCLHPSFPTVFTTTGRLSSRDPNMQNWERRNPEFKEVRRQFEAPEG